MSFSTNIFMFKNDCTLSDFSEFEARVILYAENIFNNGTW